MRRLHRSLCASGGLALLLVWTPPLALPARAQGSLDSPPASALGPRSGASDLMVAYQEALMAHLDAVQGNNAAAAADLHAASAHLALAQQAVAQASLATPGANSETPPAGSAGSTESVQPHGMSGKMGMPGGGGGPGGATEEPGTARILGALQSLAESTRSDVSPDSTTRMVAAMTGEFVRMGRMGGGGGPVSPALLKPTAIDHIGEAYALVGQAQSDVALKDFDEAHGALKQASRQLGLASGAAGGKALSDDIQRMQAAVKDALGPVGTRTAEAPEATMRAVREITTSLSALAESGQGQAGSAD